MTISSLAFDLKICGISTKTKKRKSLEGESMKQKLLEMVQVQVSIFYFDEI